MPDPSASRSAHRRERAARRRRQQLIWIAGGAGALLVAAGGVALAASLLRPGDEAGTSSADSAPTAEPIEFDEDTPAAAAGAAPCTTLTVLSSFENAEMVAELVEAYNAQPRDVGGHCVTAVATKGKSGVAAEQAATGFSTVAEAQRPVVWVPDAASWISVARAEGGEANLPESGTSIGRSSIVLAMPGSLADAIGWADDPPSWSEVWDASADPRLWTDLGHPEWGGFKLGKTSPLVASSGEAALLASFGAAAGSIAELTAAQVADGEVRSQVREHELATSHYMATPEHFLWHARQAEDKGSAADFLSAVIVDEKSVWDYNRGITSRDGVTRVESTPPAEPLVPISPADGTYVADNPAVVLTGAWVDEAEAAAGDDFVRFARTVQGQEVVRTAGYRDLNDELAPEVAAVGKLADRTARPLAFPAGKVVLGAHEAFPDVRKRANVLFLVDVSGSMSEPIATGETKLAAAKAAIDQALDHFTKGDLVGLAAFSSVDDGPISPGLVSPVADIGTTRDDLERALAGLAPIEFTPLYAAVDAFATQQAKSADADRINAIVLLSDGKNETLGPTIDAQQLLSNLGGLHAHEAPLLIFTLAYGADADVATLQSISSATGAHYYDATDPTKVGEVLGDLVTSF